MGRWADWLEEIEKAEIESARAREGAKRGFQPLSTPATPPAVKPMTSGHMGTGKPAGPMSLEQIQAHRTKGYTSPGGATAGQHTGTPSLEQIRASKIGAPKPPGGTTVTAGELATAKQATTKPKTLEEIRAEKVAGYKPRKPVVTPATRPAGGGPPGQPDTTKLTKPHAPGKEGKGEEEGDKKDKPARIPGVRYANPRGPSPMDWFQYGQSHGQMTTQAGSAPSIVAAHTARLLGRVQRATGARRYGSMEAAQQRQLMATRMAGASGGVVTQRNKSLETLKSHTLPSLYLNSKLFPRGRLAKRDKSIKLPDPAEENLHPSPEDLEDTTEKAGAAQESGGRTTFPSEEQAKREDESLRYPRGVGHAGTPDLPDRGADWHGTVPGVQDVPEDSEDVDAGKTGTEQGEDRPKPKAKPKKVKQAAPPQPSPTQEAIKALAGAPRFSPGPFTPPREAQFLLQYGYSPQEVEDGDFRISPWMRAEFNRQQMSGIRKSIEGLLGRISR